jgi:short subunit dehydrogenase-like uncharacterized protein
MQAFAAASAALNSIPGVRAGLGRLTGRFVSGSTGGPDERAREGTGSAVVAVAYESEERIASVEVQGVNGYEFTARILAWGAARAAADGLRGSGALGPAEAFGLDELETGCAEAGIERA